MTNLPTQPFFPSTDLKNREVFALDLDGTIYLGQQLFSYTLEFLNGLQRRGKDFIFLTNNSSKRPEDYQAKLARFGLTVPIEKIYTSGTATIEYLTQQARGRNLYLLGTPALRQQFQAAGYRVRSRRPDWVVAGFDLTLTYAKLNRACQFIRAGTPFLATHPDFNCPIEGGGMLPDCGALTAAITAATGVYPKVMGKPQPEMLAGLLQRLKIPRDKLALVGDRLMTDIQMGNSFQIFSILVLSGETQRSQLAQARQVPDLVVERTLDILEYL